MSPAPTVSTDQVAASLSPHLAVYRHKRPGYQTVMLNSLLSLWRGPHRRLLDIGGGTGVIGQCIHDLFPVDSVTAIDVVDRFCPGLTIEVATYDGARLPYADGSFDAATLNNVIHHIPVPVRPALFREIARVVDGPLYIKDHEAAGRLDHARLSALDFIGNIPFGGMVRADYLTAVDWRALAAASGYRIAETGRASRYRHGPYAWLFPNRLEITMRWERG
ncbi:MAG TPA: class I SAM-dependent methyltransferase [Allosphingosinicella sp.]|nr:class I SAM-dependent methyltransferase [Allosphingosinicella sp.]